MWRDRGRWERLWACQGGRGTQNFLLREPDGDNDYINDAEDDRVMLMVILVGLSGWEGYSKPFCVEIAMCWTCVCMCLCFIFKKEFWKSEFHLLHLWQRVHWTTLFTWIPSDFFHTWISHLQSVCICPLKPSKPLASVRADFWRNDLKLSCGDLVCPRDMVCEIASIVMEDIFPNTLISGTDGRAYLLHEIGWSGLSERAWFRQPSTSQRFSHSVLVPLPECHTIWANLAAFLGPVLNSARSLILDTNRTPTPTVNGKKLATPKI